MAIESFEAFQFSRIGAALDGRLVDPKDEGDLVGGIVAARRGLQVIFHVSWVLNSTVSTDCTVWASIP